MAGTTTRQRYLDDVVEHMVSAGRTDLTLVVLAEAAGTSDRMLVYYFKTREALLNEAMASIRSRRRKQLATALARISRADVREGIEKALTWQCSEENAAGTRLHFEAAGRGFRNEAPFVDFLEGVVNDSVTEAEVAARRLGAEDINAQNFGTLFSALAIALAGDVQTTGQTERVERGIAAASASLARLLDTA